MLKVLRLLLLPFSVLYGMVGAVRNMLFSWGVLTSSRFEMPVISIGNITVGGTGKTPHTEYVLNYLQEAYKVAVLSRGYGRKTKGYRVVETDSIPENCGDEPCQIKQKFPDQTVVVCEDRRLGIETIMSTKDADVVVLDDAYQHRWVKPGLSLLLVDYSRPIFKDFVMPTGSLREFATGSQRADVVIVSKCPATISTDEQAHFAKRLNIKPNQELLFSTFQYGDLKMVFSSKTEKVGVLKGIDVLLLSGIANPKPLQSYLEEQGARVTLCRFADHHQFTDADMHKVDEAYAQLGDKRCVVTTEKDAVRLRSGLTISDKIKNDMYYLPIAVKILDREEVLLQKIKNYVDENKRSC